MPRARPDRPSPIDGPVLRREQPGNELIDESGAEIATAGWLPGSDWTGTAFQPIYDKAARGDFGAAAMFFGQLVWLTIMGREERWGSGRYQVDGRDIGSRTYFRLRG
ncbi:MAG: hypothetical protein H0U52_09840 [Chloroflexi bacterium]|nr:hypothetical protein [Chloroflexota bacterium]